MKYKLNKIAVLGSGLMGSGLACHFAGAGFEVLLLDLPSAGPDKNQIVNAALKKALESKPSPIYLKSFISRIKTGNFEDDLNKIRECDWIIEVVVEKFYLARQSFITLKLKDDRSYLIYSSFKF